MNSKTDTDVTPEQGCVNTVDAACRRHFKFRFTFADSGATWNQTAGLLKSLCTSAWKPNNTSALRTSLLLLLAVLCLRCGVPSARSRGTVRFRNRSIVSPELMDSIRLTVIVSTSILSPDIVCTNVSTRRHAANQHRKPLLISTSEVRSVKLNCICYQTGRERRERVRSNNDSDRQDRNRNTM